MHSAIVVPPVILKNHIGHAKLDTNIVYGRFNRKGGQARQAAILNEARKPSDKITSTKNNENISNLEEFFVEKNEKPVNPNPKMPGTPRSRWEPHNNVHSYGRNTVNVEMPGTSGTRWEPYIMQRNFPFPQPYNNPYLNNIPFQNHNMPYNYNMQSYAPFVPHFNPPEYAKMTPDVKAVTPITNNIYNGNVTINNVTVHKVSNPYAKKKTVTTVTNTDNISVLKHLDKNLFDLVANDKLEELIMTPPEDDDVLIYDTKIPKNPVEIPESAVLSDEIIRRNFVGDFILPENCGESEESDNESINSFRLLTQFD